MNTEITDRKRIFLVDDHPMVREHLAKLIMNTPDLQVCGEADDAPAAIDAIDRAGADIIIVDLSLKNSNGLELIKDIRARGWKVPLLVLSMHDESMYAERVLRAGATGYISKQESSHEILKAIRCVLQGKVYLNAETAAGVLHRFVGRAGPGSTDPVSSLADRELEVFQMIGSGQSTRRIAEVLGLSVKTVESYRERIKQKLALDDGVQLLQRAVQWVENSQIPKGTQEEL
jgi:DNA-binding NarL/FixJ family response regulator